ncbi:MAG TPA: hypothetical protein DCL17_02600, partial [Dehalococcoidia bacterium]|nr:hypothetical protein [Dehalococcoidia bacterium]
HPELLDWLALEFMESGWDIKHMVRLLLTSSSYRQSSLMTDKLQELDPYNRLVARQSRYRVEAELVRDAALFISGLLVDEIGGRSVKPYQPAGYWKHLNFPKRKWQHDKGSSQYRRGVYTHWQRTFLHPSLLAFDAPSREECTAERMVSNTPQAALALLNDPTYVEAARAVGVPVPRILMLHVLPNIVSIIIVQATFTLAGAILAEASLSFLGAGVPEYVPSWGNIIATGQGYMQVGFHISFFPGLFLTITVLAVVLIGDSIRDHLDPKLRGRLKTTAHS